MSRNLKKDYLMKLIKTETKNGYKFDLANYLHNPSRDHEYPAFRKVLAEDDSTLTVREVLYFKRYDGTGTYEAHTMTFAKAEDCNGWNIAKNVVREVLAAGNRFNLNTLISFC